MHDKYTISRKWIETAQKIMSGDLEEGRGSGDSTMTAKAHKNGKTTYTITVEGQVITRNSKRSDFRFAVVHFQDYPGIKNSDSFVLVGMRPTRDGAEKLRHGYRFNPKAQIIELEEGA